MLIILVVDFKEFTKTSFVSKLKAHPGKVHIAIVVGTRNVGHLKRRVGMKKETGMACMPWHLRTRGTNGNRLPDTDGKVPGDRWRMKIFI